MSVSSFIPPILVPLLRRISPSSLRFDGNFDSWDAALARAGGYDDGKILARIVEGTRAVRAGEVTFERDGVVFNAPDYPFHIIAALLSAKRPGSSPLTVVDFGGSLGSTYHQCRPFFGDDLLWYIIEQAHFVRAGKAEFESDELKFLDSLDHIPTEIDVDAILAASVLQYLPDPWSIIDSFSNTSATKLIVDRTPFTLDGTQDHIVVQHVPSRIYEASYPCRIFSHTHFLSRISEHWTPIADFRAAEGAYSTQQGRHFEFRSMILERRR